MKTAILILLLVCVEAAQGQSTVDKTIIGLYKAGYTVDKAGNTIDQAAGIKGKVKSLFGKKKESAKPDTVAVAKAAVAPVTPSGVKTTVITLVGVDFSKLKAIHENVGSCGGVQSSSIKFAGESSTINVTHTGTTDSLMKLIFTTCKDIFTEKNVVSFEEGAVKLKV